MVPRETFQAWLGHAEGEVVASASDEFFPIGEVLHELMVVFNEGRDV